MVLNRGQEAIKAAVEAVELAGWGLPGERPIRPLRSGFHDMPYADNPYPSREMRMLAAFRIWGIMHYFNPLVSGLGGKWDDVLVELLPKFSEAKRDALEYHLAIAEMAARTADPSCFTSSSELTSLFGTAAPAFEARFVEGQLAITHVFQGSQAEHGAQVGDVILKIDGVGVKDRSDKVSRYLPAPAPQALQAALAHWLLTGPAEGTLKLTVRGKDNAERDIAVPTKESNLKTLHAHRDGDAFRLIDNKIGYADLERIKSSGVDALFEKLNQVPAIIFDFGYPSEAALTIASRLAQRSRPVAATLQRNLVGIGLNSSHVSVVQTDFRIESTSKSRYTGKTVALIDDSSQGISGESAMCFKAANDTVLIGSAAFPISRDIRRCSMFPATRGFISAARLEMARRQGAPPGRRAAGRGGAAFARGYTGGPR